MEEIDGKEEQHKIRKESKTNKDDKDPKTKTTGSKLKERWLLTRKTWRYMSDAGKRLFPDDVNPHKKEDVAKVEQHFQEVSESSEEYILWDPHRKKGHDYDSSDSDVDQEDQSHSIPGTSSQTPDEMGRERISSIGDLGWSVSSEIYNHLLRTFGASTLHRVASKLLEEQLREEDEIEFDDDEGELIEIDGRTMRSIGSQTDPYLDMCVQTDPDATAQDLVCVGAETKAETEAAVAQKRASQQEQLHKGEIIAQIKHNEPLYQQPLLIHQTQMRQLEQPQLPISREISQDSQSIIHSPQEDLQTQGLGVQQDFQQQYDQSGQQVNTSNLQRQQHSQTCHVQQQEQETQTSHQQLSQPPVLKKFWARRESLTAKSEAQYQLQQQEKAARITGSEKKESVSAKWAVAAKLATLHASSLISKDQPKQPEKKKQNEFKLGLKCDIDAQQGFNKLAVEKTLMDKFKTINYDKTLRNIKSKWVPSPEEEAFIRSLERSNELEREMREKKLKMKEKEEKHHEKEKVKEKEKEKKKKKARGIQVGEPLPQFILNSFRINSPVEIIHATRRRLRRFSSKAESISESESSIPASGMVSPRFSICILEEHGNRELTVSESEAYKLTQMGIPFTYKGSPNLDTSLDISEFEGLKDSGMIPPPPHHHYQRSLFAVQASGYLSNILYNLKSGRLPLPIGGSGVRSAEKSHKVTQSLLQHLLPTVMQRARGSGGGGHASRLVAKRIWKTRSKSQSRASAGTTSIWTPMVSTSKS